MVKNAAKERLYLHKLFIYSRLIYIWRCTRINHGVHGGTRSFDAKIVFSSVKLRVLRGKKFLLVIPD